MGAEITDDQEASSTDVATGEESKVSPRDQEFTMSIVLCSHKPFTVEMRQGILHLLKAKELEYSEAKRRHDRLRY